MFDQHKSLLLKWSLFLGIGAVNVVVACIWIPAHLAGASQPGIILNNVFERVEKRFFLVVDLMLNLYFLYLVRHQLISYGLNKY